MKDSYTKQHFYVAFQGALIIFCILLGVLALGFPSLSFINSILLGATLLLAMLGITYGLIISLGACLAIMFLFGTVLFWNAFFSSTLLLSVRETIYWMLAFIVATLLTGLFQRWINTILAENKEMNEKFEGLVSIDAATGLDNGKRFLLELQAEVNRAQRTKIPFSLLFIKIMFFDQFKKLYGHKETSYLLSSLSQILVQETRVNDRKFRFNEDTFALILPNTVGENVDLVIEKIETLLKEHQLENKNKQITLTIAFGKSSYQEEIISYMELVEDAQKDLEHYVQ